MAIIKESKNSRCWRGCSDQATLLHCWQEWKLVQPLRKTMRRFLKELKVELPFYPAIPLLGIYTEEKRSLYEKDTCTRMFIVAEFTTAKIWNQSNCPSINEWIKCVICIMEYYSAIKGNKVMAFAATWMKLEAIILREVTQEWKTKYHMFSLISGS